MKRIFLIDYENVSDMGLEGFFQLTAEDSVYVFYSSKANKIGIEFLSELRRKTTFSDLNFLKAMTGNQALDFQLSSFLGSLVAASDPADTEFFIVSKDKGYNCLPHFWAAQCPGTKISVIRNIAEVLKVSAPAEAKKAELPAEPKNALPSAEALSGADSEEALPAETEAETPETLPESSSEEVPAPESAEAQTDAGTEEAAPAKKKSARGKRAKKVAPADRAIINDAVQQTLSKAKFDSDTVGAVSSLINKSYKDGKSRQDIYHGILKTFGQKRGLDIYKNIKAIIR